MIYLQLFLEFFHIGLFSFGGGYAALPFLLHIAEVQKWYTVDQLSDMIAIASITPGPVGINVATFAGYETSGILGAFIATTSIILPSFILVIVISELLDKFRTNKYIQSVIRVLKPTGCGLLAAVGVNMFAEDATILSITIFFTLLVLSFMKKRDPLFYLGISAIIGLVLGACKLI